MKKFSFIAAAVSCMLFSFSATSQLYWRTDGANYLLTNPVWGTNAAGPFTNAWTNNSNIFITGSAGNAITNVSNTPVGNITLTGSSSTNWGNAGTFSTGGNIRTIDIGPGCLLTWNNQPVSTAAGTGFIKNGGGTWNIGSQPNLFTAGFTLNAGTIVINGDNAIGGGVFYLNGGAIQSSATRDMAVSSIVVGGDFEQAGSGNMTWSMNMSLGSSTRSILNTTLSGSRRYLGIVSGNAGAGITFNGNGLAQCYFANAGNSFSGAVTVNGGEAVFSGDGALGTGTNITLDGGRLTFAVVDAIGNNTYITNGTVSATRTIYVGAAAGTAISVPGTGNVTMNAVITNKPSFSGNWAKQGAGRLSIATACTYSGDTYINNGMVQLVIANNRLPASTVVYMGQSASTNLGTLDLNGFSQQVAGLNSVTGINAMAATNTITSATAATLTVSGKGKFGLGTMINSGVISGLVSLTKSGIDTLELADANTYTGNTLVSGGVLRLSRSGGTTIPGSSNVTINGGVLRVSSNQMLNNLSVISGQLLIDAGITLAISGTYTGGGTITNNGTIVITTANNFPGTTSTVTAGFNNLTIGATVNLDQSLIVNGALLLNGSFNVLNYILTLNGPAIGGTATHLHTTTASSLVFSGIYGSVFIPASVTLLGNLTVNNNNGVNLNSILSVYSSVTFSAGTLAITAGNKLEFNGASLTAAGGYVSGTSTSDLGVVGTGGGTINLPTNSNISLRFITISGNRVLKMNGVNNIALYGSLSVASGSTYDNGGETQLINGGTASITVSGTFITRDIQGLYGTNTAIPGIFPTLNTGCTVEYALAGNQAVQGGTVPTYKNIRFSGSGIKLLASSNTTVNGTVFITGSAIVNTNGFNFGGPSTALSMDNGRLIVTTSLTQPAMQGAYNLTGGVVEFKGAYNETIRTQTYQNIEVTGAGVANSSGNITLRNSGTFTVVSTGTFLINDNSIIGISPFTNTQTVTVQNGGLFRTGNNEGFNGFTSTLTNNSSVHANISNIVLAAGSTVEYSRNGDQPITNSNGLTYHHLILSGTSGIKNAPVGNLTINGNISKTGAAIFAHNNGTVLINGTSVQSYTSSAPVMAFYNIDLNNAAGFSTNSDMTIVKQLSFEDNARINLQAGNITLKSDATSTANVGIIPVTASITYQPNTGFIAERYIATGTLAGEHSKGWQFLAVPVNGNKTVDSTWQEGSLSANDDLKPGYGTQITSNLAGATGLGFDVLSPGGPSMKTYNSAGTGSWVGIPNTLTYPLYNAKGYMIFVRGDRSVINFSGANSSPKPTTLRSRGKLFVPVSNPPAITNVLPGKFESIGNPYASAIDLTVFADNHTGDVQDIYYVWDPQLTVIGAGSSYGYGGYRTLTRNGSTYDVTPPGGNYGAATNFIQSGQAFFVKSVFSGGTAGFSENCKVSGSSLVTKTFPAPMAQMRTNLYVIRAQGNTLIDGVLSNFKNTFSARLDKEDAYKFRQTGENISIFSQDTTLSVECRPLINTADTIYYSLGQLTQQIYMLELIPQLLNLPGLTGYLQDNFLQTETLVSLSDTTRVAFQADNSNPLSKAADRFRLVFSRRHENWPGSVDALTKSIVPTFAKQTHANRQVANESQVISVYPNPVVDHILRLSVNGVGRFKGKIRIINSQGSVVYRKSFESCSLLKTLNIPLSLKGNYQFVFTDITNETTAFPIIIE